MIEPDEPPAAVVAPGAEVRLAALVAGPLTALAVAGALVGVRGALGLANVGFVMVLVVLCAGVVGGRAAGVLTAVVAALAFNVFHTQPYLSLGVAARQDVVSIALLAVVGVACGEVGSRAGNRRRELISVASIQRDTDLMLAAAAAGASQEEVWRDLRASVLSHAGAQRCRFLATGLAQDSSPEELRRTFVVPVVAGATTVGQLCVVVRSPRITRPTAEIVQRSASLLGVVFCRDGHWPDRLD